MGYEIGALWDLCNMHKSRDAPISYAICKWLIPNLHLIGALLQLGIHAL